MEIIFYIVLFFIILFFLKSLIKILSITSNATNNVINQTALLFEDTEQDVLERYKLANEILEMHKPYLTDDEYQELYNIIHPQKRTIDTEKEEENCTINALLRTEVTYTKSIIDRKKYIEKNGKLPDFFLDL